MKALKPCPFCGAAPVHEFWPCHGPEATLVYCGSKDCAASTSTVGDTADQAADYWNTRAQPEPAPVTTE